MTVLMSAIFAIMNLGRGMQGCPVRERRVPSLLSRLEQLNANV